MPHIPVSPGHKHISENAYKYSDFPAIGQKSTGIAQPSTSP